MKKEQKEVFPIQLLTKIGAWVVAVFGFLYLFVEANKEQYFEGLAGFALGAVGFGVLMTLAKIADSLDELKKANADK
jgi:hypothetical protein